MDLTNGLTLKEHREHLVEEGGKEKPEQEQKMFSKQEMIFSNDATEGYSNNLNDVINRTFKQKLDKRLLMNYISTI